jgi:ABC-type amino acid transport system permease subunit
MPAALFNVNGPNTRAPSGTGLIETLEFTPAGFAGAAVLGLVLALMRLSPMRPATG